MKENASRSTMTGFIESLGMQLLMHFWLQEFDMFTC